MSKEIEQKQELISMAMEVRERAYAPYSRFLVGAALLANSGKVYTGCNIENASFTPTNCAERTAFFKAVSDGEKHFAMIAVVGGPATAKQLEYCPPCGVCRQVMREFCDPEDFLVILGQGSGEWQEYRLKDLLPMGFGPSLLGQEHR